MNKKKLLEKIGSVFHRLKAYRKQKISNSSLELKQNKLHSFIKKSKFAFRKTFTRKKIIRFVGILVVIALIYKATGQRVLADDLKEISEAAKKAAKKAAKAKKIKEIKDLAKKYNQITPEEQSRIKLGVLKRKANGKRVLLVPAENLKAHVDGLHKLEPLKVISRTGNGDSFFILGISLGFGIGSYAIGYVYNYFKKK